MAMSGGDESGLCLGFGSGCLHKVFGAREMGRYFVHTGREYLAN